jgi:hypothetical protein
MDIHVFKTNIAYKKDVADIRPHLEAIPEVNKWTVDLHDKDKVLRIVSHNLAPAYIQQVVKHAGYLCEELQD